VSFPHTGASPVCSVLLLSLIVVWALASGVAILATAFTHHRTSTSSGAWWEARPASAAWYGVAFPVAPASGFTLGYSMLQAHPGPDPNLVLLDVLAPVVLVVAALPTAVCLLLARARSNRDVKRTIQAGLARPTG